MSQEITIDNTNPITAYLARPEGTIRGAIIVIHEIWGLNANIKSIADRFAAEGYLALAPQLLEELDFSSVDVLKLQEELFTKETGDQAREKLGSIIKPIQEPSFKAKTISRIKSCFDYLDNLSEVDHKIAITGFCFGGTYSFSLAVNEPKLRLALPFYGHLTHTPEEVAQIKCPVYAFYGQNDETLVFNVPEIAEMMKVADVKFDYKIYQNCGHAYFNDTNRKTFNKEAADDSWSIVLAQLAENL